MLEDESGRIRLIGERLNSAHLVTGIILGALGIETNSGDFEVVDICFAGMAPQHRSAEVDKGGDAAMDTDGIVSFSSLLHGDAKQFADSQSSALPDTDEWIGVVSGLEVGAPSAADGQLQLLAEYLTGETGALQDQAGVSRISRLIIAGNSLTSVITTTEETEKKAVSRCNRADTADRLANFPGCAISFPQRRYGQENSTFSPHPIRNLSAYLTDIARSMPIHLLPGPLDPTGTLLPQQPLPRAMFGEASSFGSFSCETNPSYIYLRPSAPSDLSSPPPTGKASTSSSSKYERSILVHSGQPLDDMFRYLPSPPVSRLSIAESTLHWRHLAPTAPDTLWCHPYLKSEPFVMHETPDIYLIGNQPAFKTKLVVERAKQKNEGGDKRCRIVLVPKFRETGVVALVNLRTLQVRTVCFAVAGMSAGGES